MEYSKNVAFTKVIKTDGRFREFNFRKKPSSVHPTYNIDVSDESGIRHYFTLIKISHQWIFGELDVAQWIKEGALQFYESIEKFESGDNSANP
jgi:hypothetical protein